MSEKRLDCILDALMQIAEGDYDIQLAVSEFSDEIDAVAMGINLMADDIREAVAKLNEREKQLQEAQRLARMGSFVWNVKLNELFWSDQMYRVYGLDPATFQLSIDSFMKFVHEDDINQVQKLVENILVNKAQTINELTFRIHDLNKEVRYLHSRWQHLFDGNGQLTRITGTVQDITKEKESEILLKSQYEELKKTNQELDRFVYSASHDLRSPLASLLGLISLLETETSGSQQKEYINLMRVSVERLDHLISNIVNYSRNSRLELQHEEIDFEREVKSIIENLQFMEGVRDMDITINVQIKAPFYNDNSRLQVLLNNLISNAIKYRNPQQQKSFIKIDVIQTRSSAKLSIEDNGLGISKGHQEKVFDMFYRASKASEGSGLGLYIVKETVEKLNGTLNLLSAEGKGSKFTIVLPNFFKAEKLKKAS